MIKCKIEKIEDFKNIDINLDDIKEIFKSTHPIKFPYIRFVTFKRKQIYWKFDNIKDQDENHKLIVDEFVNKKISTV